MVRWLDWLGYRAESHQKVVSLRLGFTIRRLENSVCQPSSKWVQGYLFLNKGRIRK